MADLVDDAVADRGEFLRVAGRPHDAKLRGARLGRTLPSVNQPGPVTLVGPHAVALLVQADDAATAALRLAVRSSSPAAAIAAALADVPTDAMPSLAAAARDGDALCLFVAGTGSAVAKANVGSRLRTLRAGPDGWTQKSITGAVEAILTCDGDDGGSVHVEYCLRAEPMIEDDGFVEADTHGGATDGARLLAATDWSDADDLFDFAPPHGAPSNEPMTTTAALSALPPPVGQRDVETTFDFADDEDWAFDDEPEPETPTSFGRLRFDDGVVIELDKSLLIGRNPSAAQALARGMGAVSVPDTEKALSRTHIEVLVSPTGIDVLDAGSTNGTTVETNGADVPLVTGEPFRVRAGDRVILGGVASFIVESNADGSR